MVTRAHGSGCLSMFMTRVGLNIRVRFHDLGFPGVD